MNDDRTTQAEYTSELPTVPPRGRGERRSRRKVAAIAVAVMLAGAGAGALLAATGDGDSGGTKAAAAAPERPTVTTLPTTPAAADASVPAQDDTSQDDSPPPAPGHLAVSTSHLNLGQNVFTGSFEVRNDGESPIDWAWDVNHPAVSASPTGGTLAPGEAVVVDVTVHWQQLANGGYMFQTHVTGGDQQLNVLVSGSKQVVVNPGVQLPEPQIKP